MAVPLPAHGRRALDGGRWRRIASWRERASVGPSQHSRQAGTDRAARITVASGLLARAVGGHVGGEREQLLVAAVPRDQIGEPVSTAAPALRALDAEQVELADQVTEDDRAVARHCGGGQLCLKDDQP